MTGLEIGLAIGLGAFIVFAILTWIGAAVEQDRLTKTIAYTDKRAAVAQEHSGYFSRKVLHVTERLHRVDQCIDRAISRIRSEHTDERVRRFEYKAEPSHYYGQQHNHIADGLLRALNIVEEETGGYKEVEEEPSPAHLSALADRLAKVAKQLDAIKQSQEADRQRQQFVADQQRRRDVTQPPTLPPFADCKVCGTGAHTYRWGQVTSTFHSLNHKQTTRATVEWEKYDPNFDMGWFPVCAHHACVLDKYGTVTRTSHGRNPRTGATTVTEEGDPHLGGYRCGG